MFTRKVKERNGKSFLALWGKGKKTDERIADARTEVPSKTSSDVVQKTQKHEDPSLFPSPNLHKQLFDSAYSGPREAHVSKGAGLSGSTLPKGAGKNASDLEGSSFV